MIETLIKYKNNTPESNHPPVYNVNWLNYETAEELFDVLDSFPLDSDFITWAAVDGISIVYQNQDGPGYFLNNIREILVNSNQSQEDQDLTIAHELIHAAIPDIPLEFDYVIDEIARNYSTNQEFMTEVMQKIPSMSDYMRKNQLNLALV